MRAIDMLRSAGAASLLALVAIAAAPQASAQTAPSVAQQIQALIAEKESRTDAQKKIDSQLMMLIHPERFGGAPFLLNKPGTVPGTVTVVVQATNSLVFDLLLAVLNLLGEVLASSGLDGTIKIQLFSSPLASIASQLESIAARPEVMFISPEYEPVHHKASTSEGDKTHAAETARIQYGKTGAGSRICVISDGIDSAALRVASGDLPPASSIYLLPGQTGSGDEGTAMLEIIYDLAPGAQLGFATSNGGEAQFAQNILDLANPAKGACNIIVDDTDYVTESPFQDGVIATAVNTVASQGVLYVSSAGNSGNHESGMSGTWEGDFNGASSIKLPSNANYVMHEWTPGVTANPATSPSKRLYMHWAEPMGKARVDYDFYVLDSAGTKVIAFSTNTQTGAQTAFEYTEAATMFDAGVRIVVAKPVLAEDRVFNIQWYRGTLTHATSGATRGHSAAAGAISVGATPAATSYGIVPNGPYPNAFNPAAKVEWFSSDGPRRIFFDVNGALLNGAAPGFKSTGGVVRSKPELVAADGVKTDTPAFATFYGTSAAAPHVAAIAGLVRQANPGINVSQLRQKLLQSSLAINNTEKVRGAGVLMASLALQPTAVSGALDIDGNGQYDARTDGVLILRWLFGLTGNGLTAGAVGTGAQRSAPADIVAYLEGKRAAFDIDSNGKTEALTDGLLIVRYLLGLRGSSLVGGAVAGGAQRGTAALIQPYILSLMP